MQSIGQANWEPAQSRPAAWVRYFDSLEKDWSAFIEGPITTGDPFDGVRGHVQKRDLKEKVGQIQFD